MAIIAPKNTSVETLKGCGYSFEEHPNIKRWATDFEAKESFQEGIIKWCPDFSKV